MIGFLLVGFLLVGLLPEWTGQKQPSFLLATKMVQTQKPLKFMTSGCQGGILLGLHTFCIPGSTGTMLASKHKFRRGGWFSPESMSWF